MDEEDDVYADQPRRSARSKKLLYDSFKYEAIEKAQIDRSVCQARMDRSLGDAQPWEWNVSFLLT
jgi:hypothetical protein